MVAPRRFSGERKARYQGLDRLDPDALHAYPVDCPRPWEELSPAELRDEIALLQESVLWLKS